MCNSLWAQIFPHDTTKFIGFYSLKKKSLLGFTNSNFGKDPQVYCVSKKDESEEVEKKLPNEYEPLFIPK